MLKRILSTSLSAQALMDKDDELLNSLLIEDKPILHLYRWPSPTISYGHFIQAEALFDLEEAKKHGVELAKRPTGGGALLHYQDYVFSVFLPASHPKFSRNTLENYQLINGLILKAVQNLKKQSPVCLLQTPPLGSYPKQAQSFCMAKPTQYDVFMENQKVGGAAQRCKKQGFLHQGVLNIFPMDHILLKRVLKNAEQILPFMTQNSVAIFSQSQGVELDFIYSELDSALTELFTKHL